MKYVANFNSAGQLITSIGSKTLTNYLEINGALPTGTFGGTLWAAQPNQLLHRATLLDSNPNNGTADLIGISNNALGFKTFFTGGWAANNLGLNSGSIVENLEGVQQRYAKFADRLSSKRITGVSSVAAVPVPAAFWLFGTGLMTFLARRRKSAGLGLTA